MSSEKRNQNNIVNFPGTINTAVSDQQKEIVKASINIETKLLNDNTWHNTILTIPEIKIIANYGEAINFKPQISSRLNSVLALTLIKRTILEDLI